MIIISSSNSGSSGGGGGGGGSSSSSSSGGGGGGDGGGGHSIQSISTTRLQSRCVNETKPSDEHHDETQGEFEVHCGPDFEWMLGEHVYRETHTHRNALQRVTQKSIGR